MTTEARELKEDWPPRLRMTEFTPAEAAQFLRNLCEQTVRGSGNWDNMQEIFVNFLDGATKAKDARIAALEAELVAAKATIERMRKEAIQAQRDAFADARDAAAEAHWQAKQGDEYGSY